MSFHDIPAPRPLSLLLVGATWFFHYLSHVSHADFNMWLATVAGVCAVINYAITWVSKLRKK